jgi:hypothetical protein
MPHHPGAFMKIIKKMENAMSAANEERLQVLNPRVIWDGSVDRFEVLEMMLKVIMDKLLQETYLTQNLRRYTLRGADCYADFEMKYHQLPRFRKIHVHCTQINSKQKQTRQYSAVEPIS